MNIHHLQLFCRLPGSFRERGGCNPPMSFGARAQQLLAEPRGPQEE